MITSRRIFKKIRLWKCITLVQVSDQWRPLVNTVVNIRVSCKAGNCCVTEKWLISQEEFCPTQVSCTKICTRIWKPPLKPFLLAQEWTICLVLAMSQTRVLFKKNYCNLSIEISDYSVKRGKWERNSVPQCRLHVSRFIQSYFVS